MSFGYDVSVMILLKILILSIITYHGLKSLLVAVKLIPNCMIL